MILDLEGPDGLAQLRAEEDGLSQLRAEALLIKVPPLLANLPLLPNAAPPCGKFLGLWPALPVCDSRVLGLGGWAGDLWPPAGLYPGLVPPGVLAPSSPGFGPPFSGSLGRGL